MLILIDYDNDIDNTIVKQITNKICETYDCNFFDIKKISENIKDIQSLKFITLKKILDSDFSEIGKNVVMDLFILNKFTSDFDIIQKEFINKLLETHGIINIFISDKKIEHKVINEDKKQTILFQVNKDFFVDLKEKIDLEITKLKNNPLYSFLNGINGYGFYIGNFDIKNSDIPIKLIVLPGNSGQKIAYYEYVEWILKTNKLNPSSLFDSNDNKFIFVRQHHPFEAILKHLI